MTLLVQVSPDVVNVLVGVACFAVGLLLGMYPRGGYR
jgi:hypothetical protein